MAETEQGDHISDDGESSVHSESERKKSVSLKNLQVCVTDISLDQEDVTNGGSVKRGRGRPKGTGSKSKLKGANMNGGTPRPRGRPKSSTKRRLESSGEDSEDSLPPPRKRGRPKGSPKKLIHKRGRSVNSATQNTPKRGRPKKSAAKGKRGRPKKIVEEGAVQQKPVAGGARKKLGRPKGSRNKSEFSVRLESSSGRPTRAHVTPEKLNVSLPRKSPGKRGRPKKISRGRPRKSPLPPDEELYQPRVWKALGRPRKYPKEDQAEGASSPDTPRRGRGRPRKSESKKGVHLKKFNNDGTPSKPSKAAKKKDGPPRKRGRPKGSGKNKAIIDDSSEKIANSDQSAEEAQEEVQEETYEEVYEDVQEEVYEEVHEDAQDEENDDGDGSNSTPPEDDDSNCA